MKFYQGTKSVSEAEKFIVHSSSPETCAPNIRKAILISMILSVVPSISGVTLLLNYASETLSAFTSIQLPIEPVKLISSITICAIIITICLIEYVGRKYLLVLCQFATAIALFGYQLSKYQFQNIEQIQFILLSLMTVSICSGILTVTHIYKMDILPPKVRNLNDKRCKY